MKWLPAIKLLGEGLYIRLREDRLAAWEDEYGDEYDAMRNRLERSKAISTVSP